MVNLLRLLWLIILLLDLFITKSMAAFVPTSRYYQGSVIIGNKMYFLGGIVNSGKGTNSLFYLDVSLPFNSANPKWTDLTSVAPIPVNSAFAPPCVGGSNKATIFLFEHHKTNNDNSTTIVTFTFDSTTQKWSTPTTTGAPQTREDMKAVIDKNGKIYINGGFEPYKTQKSYNSTFIFDSSSLSWTNGSNAPIIRSAYTATLLSNGLIVYIGGTNDDPSPEINMNLISIYNTNNGTWSLMNATGDPIMARQSYAAVLNKNGFIVIYGGAANNYTVAPNPALATLDTNSMPYKWSAKQFNSVYAPPPLAYHSAQLVGDYMIIAFGAGLLNAKFDLATAPNNNIFILDTSNYTWVSSINNVSTLIVNPSGPSNPNPTTSNSSDNNSSHITIPLIAGLGSAFIIIASIIGIVFWYRKRRLHYIATPGTNTRE
ncbi:kelch repeat protein [Gigaspora margarita]|uniref:Kelch repeat protein n=1 Tax=Gigaspora margarita TaxID=4874 RepID=A0A8H4AJ41_GIGMA|nr:kelch repeat protein [Gigaspora margarita]